MTLAERAQKFLQLVALGSVDEGFEQFVHPHFIHHNAFFEGHREGLLKAMKEDHLTNPNLAFETAHVFTQNETVIAHSKVTKKDAEIVVVHILRFQNNQIIELWDVGQVLPDQLVNENGWR